MHINLITNYQVDLNILLLWNSRLGTEKYKTKSATRTVSSSTVTWLEQFDFHLFEDQSHMGSHLLEINLYEKSSLTREEIIAR